MKTLLLIIVDESLSMKSKKNEILERINQFVSLQRSLNANVDGGRLILVKFNNVVTFLHRGTDLQDVPPLQPSDYRPCGRTSFFDALHQGVTLAAQLKQKDERVLGIIISDGEDTASRTNMSCKAAKQLVQKYDVKPDWTFAYIGKRPELWSRRKSISKVCYEYSGIPQNKHTVTMRGHNTARAAVQRFRQLLRKQPAQTLMTQ